MPAPVEITERLLSDAGGWQALKEGRGLWEAGKVQPGATYEPPFLRGTVRDGPAEYRAGLRIVTRTNIENLCSCRISRQRGMVCAHSMAVGIAFLKGSAPSAAPVAAATGQGSGAAEPEQAAGPVFEMSNGIHAVLYLIVHPLFTSMWEKDAVTFGL